MNERLQKINKKWGNYKTETTAGMTEMCLDMEWLITESERLTEENATLRGEVSKLNDSIDLLKQDRHPLHYQVEQENATLRGEVERLREVLDKISSYTSAEPFAFMKMRHMATEALKGADTK